MRPRDVLAANLKALMAARPELSRFQDITDASDRKLTNGTLDRIRRAEVALTLDKLADLAEVFGLEPWQLLVENLNPLALPRLADAAFVREIRELLRSVEGPLTPIAQAAPPAHPLERKPDPEAGRPALTQALITGTGTRKNAARKNGRVQKPRTGRGA